MTNASWMYFREMGDAVMLEEQRTWSLSLWRCELK